MIAKKGTKRRIGSLNSWPLRINFSSSAATAIVLHRYNKFEDFFWKYTHYGGLKLEFLAIDIVLCAPFGHMDRTLNDDVGSELCPLLASDLAARVIPEGSL